MRRQAEEGRTMSSGNRLRLSLNLNLPLCKRLIHIPEQVQIEEQERNLIQGRELQITGLTDLIDRKWIHPVNQKASCH